MDKTNSSAYVDKNEFLDNKKLVSHILSYLPFSAVIRFSRVSKSWKYIIDSDPDLWESLLKSSELWFGGETAFANAIFNRRRRSSSSPPPAPLPHPYKLLLKSRFLTLSKYISNPRPHHISFPAHERAVVTCLLFSHGRIISASDNHSIHVYNPYNGNLVLNLQGHEGGVWALAVAHNILVSGGTDRTVRIWDLNTGKCDHVFGGHSGTVRCLTIVKPEWIDVPTSNGGTRKEKWPKRPLIITGSRDHSLRVWTLPKPGEASYRCATTDVEEEFDASENPYHQKLLKGHDHAIRALAARGRTLVSGSYDCTVRVWDSISGKCQWVLTGHTQKVYSVVLDLPNNQTMSGSMDGTVRIWSLLIGLCTHTLTGHTSLVGLLSLSPSRFVSGCADSTLRVWNSHTGSLQHVLCGHTAAITCFWHDEWKVLSGADGCLKMWSLGGVSRQDQAGNADPDPGPDHNPHNPSESRNAPGAPGTVVRELLTDVTGVWQVVSEGRWCIAAANKNDATVLHVWDFGREKDERSEHNPDVDQLGQDDSEGGWIGEPSGEWYDEDMFEGSGDEGDGVV